MKSDYVLLFTRFHSFQREINIYFYFQVLLPKPNLCPAEIYELMCQCWKRDQNLRPTFKQLYHFLKRNHTTYSCEIDKQLHNVSPI